MLGLLVPGLRMGGGVGVVFDPDVPGDRTWTPPARGTAWTPEARGATWTPPARGTTWTPDAEAE